MRITRDMATEVSQSALAAEDCELACAACGATLMLIPRGALVFHAVSGPCSCSWHCCAAAEPGKHEHHLTHRPRTGNAPMSGYVPPVESWFQPTEVEKNEVEVRDE